MKLHDLIPQGILPAPEGDAIALLRAEHDRVEDLLCAFEAIKYGRADDEKKRLLAEICNELRAHALVEEEIFYPAVRAEAADDDLLNEAKVEHDGIEHLVTDLETMDASDEMLNAKMHVLGAYISHHVREEEENIFPRARESGIDLAALAKKMRLRRDKLLDDRTVRPGRRAAVRKPRSSSPNEPRVPR